MDQGVERAPHPADHPGEPVFGMAAHRVFEAVAAKFAGRTAAVCGRDRVSYGQLNTWANAIAEDLLAFGVKPEERVAIAVPKSIAHVAGVLGILKAGGAYVPIVANQPPDRLRVILGDADCRVAVASDDYLRDVLTSVGTRIDPGRSHDRDADNPDLPVGPANLAYIMYTSGSTGRPKGVMIEHAGIVRLVHGQDYMPFGPDLNFLYGGPLSFDLSTIEIYSPLLHGGKLLISPEDILTPEVVRRLAENEQLNAVCVSFSLFRALFQADASAFDRIPVIGVCGEPADPRFIRRAQERLPHARFYNAYGPTECTALATTHQIPKPCPLDPPIVPIGVPLDRMTVRIANPEGRTTADGEPGELYIGGVGLARGYLNDEGLTAARFITDPASGERVYRSGDLVRRLPDGSLAYLGRIDDQIKIRGQRIELGEIDAVLAEDPSITAAASVVFGSDEGARIGTCVVPADGALFDIVAVKERLRQRLTAAMMPTVIVTLESIPFNRNGKVDRQAALAAVEASIGAGSRGTVKESLSPTELVLRETCSILLKRPIRSVSDSFVQCGGNSLLAMMLRMKIRERFSVDVQVAEILGARDLRALAACLEEEMSCAEPMHAFQPVEGGLVAMAPSQRRLWTLHQIDPTDASYNIGYRFTMEQRPNRSEFEAAWQELHDRHPSLRSVFPSATQLEPRAELQDGVAAHVEWREAPPAESDAIRRDIVRPFDLSRSPLTRLIVWPDGAGTSGLLVMHHIVSDAWSLEVMFRDLEALYRRRLGREGGRLPDAGPGQPAHAEWQARRDQDPTQEARAAEVAQLFAGCLPTVGDLEADGGPVLAGANSVVDLPAKLVKQVEQLACELRVSTHAVLFASFASFAGPCCGTDEPIIGLAMSNRDEGPFSDAVGFFVESVPVRVELKDRSFRDLVTAAGALTEEARGRRDIGFDRIGFGAGGDRLRSPITSVFFNVIDPAPIDQASSGSPLIKPTLEEVHNGLARFDLLCTIYRDPRVSRHRLTITARAGRWRRGSTPTAAELAGILSVLLDTPSDVHETVAVRSPPRESSDFHASGTEAGAVHDHAMWTIVGIFRDMLADPDFGPDDDFFARGGDSLRAVRAFAMIREHTLTTLTAAIMFESTTPRQLADRVCRGDSGHLTAPFLCLNSPGREDHALLFPGISGEIVSMRELVEAMGKAWSCDAAVYPPLGSDRVDTLADLVDHFYEAIGADVRFEQTDLIGYSFGGIIAYEIAVRLQADGRRPRRLIIIDAYVITRKSLPPLQVRLLRRARKYARRMGRAISTSIRPRESSEERSVRERETQRARGEPLRQLVDARRRLIDGYLPSATYSGSVVVIQATQPEWLGPQIVRSDNGWRDWLVAPPVTIAVPCAHRDVIKGDAARDIARVINTCEAANVPDDALDSSPAVPDGGCEVVLSILRSVLENDHLAPADNFFDHGGDSLRAVRAFAAIRERLGVDLPIATIFRHPSAAGLARAIHSARETTGLTRVVRLTEESHGGNLVIFPGVSGETTSLRPLIGQLAPQRTIHAVDYPGVSESRDPASSIDELVTSVVPDQSDATPTPDVLLGYSFGGIIAYETAVRLAELGREPRLLVLMDSHLLDRFPSADGPPGIGRHLANIVSLPPARMPGYVGLRVVRLLTNARKRLLRTEDYESQPHIRRLVAANLALLENYRPSAPYAGRVLIIRGRRPDWLLARQDDGMLGWSDHLAQRPAVVTIDSDHAGLLSPDAAEKITRAVRDQLDAS